MNSLTHCGGTEFEVAGISNLNDETIEINDKIVIKIFENLNIFNNLIISFIDQLREHAYIYIYIYIRELNICN